MVVLCRHMVGCDLPPLAGGLYGEGYNRPFIRVAEALFFLRGSWNKGDTPKLGLFKANPDSFAALVKTAYFPLTLSVWARLHCL